MLKKVLGSVFLVVVLTFGHMPAEAATELRLGLPTPILEGEGEDWPANSSFRLENGGTMDWQVFDSCAAVCYRVAGKSAVCTKYGAGEWEIEASVQISVTCTPTVTIEIYLVGVEVAEVAEVAVEEVAEDKRDCWEVAMIAFIVVLILVAMAVATIP